MRPVRCPECRGTRWLVFPAPVFFDSAANRDEEVIEVERIRCASCEHEAPFLSPEGEAVLARYAAVLGRLGAWSKAMSQPGRGDEPPDQLHDLTDELMTVADSLDVLARDVQRIVDRLNGLIAALRA